MYKYEVDVYYNNDMMAMMCGYKETDTVSFVTTLEVEGYSFHDLPQKVFHMMQEPENMPLVRSMCTGDVVRVKVPGFESIWLVLEAHDYKVIDQPVVSGTYDTKHIHIGNQTFI